MAKRILVVEDNENNLMLIVDVLNFHGYETLVSRNGQEGIQIAKDKKPDLILMDIQMPKMDGFEAAKILKNDPAAKDIKIIGVSSYVMKGDREKALEAGFDEYISKPIDTRQLPLFIKNLIGE